MRRCDTQQLTEESIMELIRQRGNLKFSTLMVFFHISSVEALAIVEEYQKKGILDAKGKYVPEGESGAAVAKIDEKVKTAHQKEKRKLHDDVVAGHRAASDVEGQISLFDYMQFGG